MRSTPACATSLSNTHFSIWLLWPHTREAADWLRSNVSDDALWFVGALVVEPRRYVDDLLTALRDDDGFMVG